MATEIFIANTVQGTGDGLSVANACRLNTAIDILNAQPSVMIYMNFLEDVSIDATWDYYQVSGGIMFHITRTGATSKPIIWRGRSADNTSDVVREIELNSRSGRIFETSGVGRHVFMNLKVQGDAGVSQTAWSKIFIGINSWSDCMWINVEAVECKYILSEEESANFSDNLFYNCKFENSELVCVRGKTSHCLFDNSPISLGGLHHRTIAHDGDGTRAAFYGFTDDLDGYIRPFCVHTNSDGQQTTHGYGVVDSIYSSVSANNAGHSVDEAYFLYRLAGDDTGGRINDATDLRYDLDDPSITVDPWVDSANNDFTLNTDANGGFKLINNTGIVFPGISTTSYDDDGAIQKPGLVEAPTDPPGPGIGQERKIPLILESDIRAKLSQDTVQGIPNYAATRPLAVAAGEQQLYEMLFYRIPIENKVVVFRYNRIPGRLSATNPYPLGGEQHTSTILKALYAIAEGRKSGKRGPRWQDFVDAVKGSWRIDGASEPMTELDQWPIDDDPDAPGSTYLALERDVGGKVIGKHDQNAWTHPEKQLVNNLIQRGYGLFLAPPVIPSLMKQTHEWSFLKPRTMFITVEPYKDGTVSITGDQATLNGGSSWPSWADDGELLTDTQRFLVSSRDSDTLLTLTTSASSPITEGSYSLTRLFYDAPSDFSSVIGHITYMNEHTGFWSVNVVHDETIRNLREQRVIGTGQPQKAAFVAQPGTHPPEYKIQMWPDPDREYDMEYQYRRVVPALTAADSPFGNQTHAATIRAACLAEAEKHVLGKYGPEWQAFLERMTISISLDLRSVTPENFGYNTDTSDIDSTYFSKRERRGRAIDVVYTPSS